MVDPFPSQTLYPPPHGQGPSPIVTFNSEELNGVIKPEEVIDVSSYINLPLQNSSSQKKAAVKVDDLTNKKKRRSLSEVVSKAFNRLYGVPEEASVPLKPVNTINQPPTIPIGNILIKPKAYEQIKKWSDTHSQGPDPQGWKEIGGALVGRRRLEPNGTYTVLVEGYIPVPRPGSLAEFSITQQDFVVLQPKMRQRHPGCVLLGIYHSHPGHGVFHSGIDKLALGKSGGVLTEDFQISMVMDPRHRESQVGIFVDNAEVGRFAYQTPLNGFQSQPVVQTPIPPSPLIPAARQTQPNLGNKAGLLPGGWQAPPGYMPAPATPRAAPTAPPAGQFNNPANNVGRLQGGYSSPSGTIPDPASLPTTMSPQVPDPTTNAGPPSGSKNKMGKLTATPATTPPVSTAAGVPPAADPNAVTVAPQTIVPSAGPQVAPISAGASVPDPNNGINEIYARLVREAIANRQALPQTPVFALEFSGPGPHNQAARDILAELRLQHLSPNDYALRVQTREDGTPFGADFLFDASTANPPLTEEKVSDAITKLGLGNVSRSWPVPSSLIASEYLYHSFQQLYPGTQPIYCNDVAHADIEHTGGAPRIALDMESGAHVMVSPHRATMTTPEDDALRLTIQNAKLGGWKNLVIKTDDDAHFKKTFEAFVAEGFSMDPATQQRAVALGIATMTTQRQQPRPGDCQRLDRLSMQPA